MQKQTGTLEGLGYVEQDAGEVTPHTDQTYSIHFILLLSEENSLHSQSSVGGQLLCLILVKLCPFLPRFLDSVPAAVFMSQ